VPARSPRNPQNWVSSWLRARLTDIPQGWFATATLIEATLQLETVRLESARRGYPTSISNDTGNEHPQAAVLRKILDVAHLLPERPSPGESLLVLALPDAEIAPHAPAIGHYRGRFRIGLVRGEMVSTLQLRPGATGQDDAYRLVIDDVATTQWGAVVISARESNARSFLDRRPATSLSYMLRNRRTREAAGGNAPPDMAGDFVANGFVRPDLLPPRLFFTIHDLASSGFRARGMSINFRWTSEVPSEDLSAIDAWLADAELVVVRMIDAGWVERTLDIPAFPLVPSQPPPAGPMPFGSRQ
jgi:hypothetical protein